MGACDFMMASEGPTAKEAFDAAVELAAYEHGHGGYTGTIAEKDCFEMYQPPEGVDPRSWVEGRQYPADDPLPPFEDKWGPAGCVALGDNRWLFFGSAAS